MKRGLVILLLVVFGSLLLLSFVLGFSSFLPAKKQIYNAQKPETNISPETEQKLKQQVINQFYSLVDYDLEALDEYAPTYEEMESFYHIFDEEAFVKKYPVFERAYKEVNKIFGEDVTTDRDYVLNVNTRISTVQVRNQIANFENVDLNLSNYVIDEIFIESTENNPELYNLTLRIYSEEKDSFYDFANEACWLTDRACITNLGWKFLGKYNPYTKKHTNSEYHLKDL